MIARDIIAAIATAPGRGGIGVVRVSGPSLSAFVSVLPGCSLQPRMATLAIFRDRSGQALDEGLALFFPAPHSYTGEDVLELQGHGSPVVLGQVLARCIELGARLARPGEFTERAYINGRIDLAQAEGVADLIEASNATAARAALRSLQGHFSELIQGLKDKIINLRMLVEATLDFPEEDVEFLQAGRAAERLQDLRAQLDRVLGATRQGSLLREGLRVVLVGEPNVGKSSLLNRLAGDEVAIVTEVPGTTRDTLREQIDIDGLPVHIIDTAGLRESADPVERIGIERTWAEVARADLVLLLSDATRSADDRSVAILERLPAALPRLRVVNKIDLLDQPARLERDPSGEARVWLSAKTGEGLDDLKRALWQQAGCQAVGEGLFTARARHIAALQVASSHLGQAAAHSSQLELYAEELRLAHEALGGITGEFTADDLLGEIFSRFCIGK
ncbi:MAG: tRNA uridine-5-carboxymethylaminomethyl(34) synthesis GTPase MnmE [Betaproteobacteria bacterium]|jgi:tRNA modification GTPase|nr:tRNA uridine-5-carboxymethylaminomethyl(34) synthesis GTPase MnmE [Betaproteobacteria bacterium]